MLGGDRVWIDDPEAVGTFLRGHRRVEDVGVRRDAPTAGHVAVVRRVDLDEWGEGIPGLVPLRQPVHVPEHLLPRTEGVVASGPVRVSRRMNDFAFMTSIHRNHLPRVLPLIAWPGRIPIRPRQSLRRST